MGFRDRFRRKSQAQEKQRSGSTWSVETGGHKFALHRENHYAARSSGNNLANPSLSASTLPALPPRPNVSPFPSAPPLPPRSISQLSAPAVLQHQDNSGTVRPTSGSFLAQCLSIVIGMVFPKRQSANVKDSKASTKGSKVMMLASLMGFALFILVLRYTILPFTTALGIGAFAYAITAIFLHWSDSQDRRHEITITAQKEVMIAMVEKGNGQNYAAAMASGFLETNGSRSRLIEYD